MIDAGLLLLMAIIAADSIVSSIRYRRERDLALKHAEHWMRRYVAERRDSSPVHGLLTQEVRDER